MQPNEIQPALSAEEWEHGYERSGLSLERGVSDGALYVYLIDAIPTDDGEGAASDASHKCEPVDLTALIALANAALPDDDPRKLVAADVGLIREQAASRRARYEEKKHLPVPHSDYWQQTLWEIDQLELLAARIAALLPPEAE